MNNFNIIKKGTPSFNELYEESGIILKLDKYLKKNAKIYKENLVKTDNFLFDYDINCLYLIDDKYITFLVKISNSEYKFIEINPNMDIDYIIKIINGILDKEI